MRPNFSFFLAASNVNLKPGVEEAVSERRKTFAAPIRRDENRKAYIFTSRHASSVMAKAKTEAWQATCSSLFPQSNSKSV